MESVSHKSELARTLAQATARINDIIDAAESVAESIQADAEAEAERYLEDCKREADRTADERARRLSELSDLLVERARYVSEQVDTLAAAVDRMVAEMRATSTGGDPAEVREWPRDRGQQGPSSPEKGASGTDEVLLRAVQMAIEGSDRAEIEHTLTSEFGVQEPRAIVDQVLGRRNA